MANKTDLPDDQRSSVDELGNIFIQSDIVDTLEAIKDHVFEISLLNAKNDLITLVKSEKSKHLLYENGFFNENSIPASVRDIVTTIRLLTSSTIRAFMK